VGFRFEGLEVWVPGKVAQLTSVDDEVCMICKKKRPCAGRI
jgi:hypothetical protein